MLSERMDRLSPAGSQTRSSPPFAQRSDSMPRDTVAPVPASHVSIRRRELRRAAPHPQIPKLACARQRPNRKPAARPAQELRPVVRAAVSPPQFFPVPLRPAPIEVPRDKQRLWIPILAPDSAFMRAALSRRELRLWISAKNIFSAQRNRIDEIRLASGTPLPLDPLESSA